MKLSTTIIALLPLFVSFAAARPSSGSSRLARRSPDLSQQNTAALLRWRSELAAQLVQLQRRNPPKHDSTTLATLEGKHGPGANPNSAAANAATHVDHGSNNQTGIVAKAKKVDLDKEKARADALKKLEGKK